MRGANVDRQGGAIGRASKPVGGEADDLGIARTGPSSDLIEVPKEVEKAVHHRKYIGLVALLSSNERIISYRRGRFWTNATTGTIASLPHSREASLLLAYVDHHDKAYAWAARRRIEAHPKTGAIQIVEVRERVQEMPLFPRKPSTAANPFAKLADNDLLAFGVPIDWLPDVRAASEDDFLELAPRLQAEAAEALLQLAAVGPQPMAALEPKFSLPYIAGPPANGRLNVKQELDSYAGVFEGHGRLTVKPAMEL